MVWLLDDEKNFEDIFIHFDTIHERDRQTDTQTLHDDIAYMPRLCMTSRGKNQEISSKTKVCNFTLRRCRLD